MQKYKKQYTITISGKVQEVGFRGYLEDLCKRLRVPSKVYNTAVDELKLLCEADQNTLKELSSLIKDYRLAEIRDINIREGLELPFPPFRAVLGIEQEIYNRLDEGVKILYSIKDDTKRLDKLDKLDKLDEITQTLKDISNKL